MTLALADPVFRSYWERRLGSTESPIEALFLEQFCSQAVELGYGIGPNVRIANETIVVTPQKWFDRVRVDFLVQFHFFGRDLQIVVECDGHNFHDRTKAQVSRDKKRDRTLQRLGLKVFRFAGSELRHHARMCAAEVLDEIMSFQTKAVVESCPEPTDLSEWCCE